LAGTPLVNTKGGIMPDEKKSMPRGAIVKAYFGGEGYPPVTAAELLDFAKRDGAGYRWVADEAAKELGVEVAKSA